MTENPDFPRGIVCEGPAASTARPGSWQEMRDFMEGWFGPSEDRPDIACPIHQGDPCLRCGACGKEWVIEVVKEWMESNSDV
jgi:hypothetical protein